MCRPHQSGISFLLILVCLPTAASAKLVTEIICGTTLLSAKGLVLDDSGNTHIADIGA
jgi:hypothetical protein